MYANPINARILPDEPHRKRNFNAQKHKQYLEAKMDIFSKNSPSPKQTQSPALSADYI